MTAPAGWLQRGAWLCACGTPNRPQRAACRACGGARPLPANVEHVSTVVARVMERLEHRSRGEPCR